MMGIIVLREGKRTQLLGKKYKIWKINKFVRKKLKKVKKSVITDNNSCQNHYNKNARRNNNFLMEIKFF